jgi:L-asparaginase
MIKIFITGGTFDKDYDEKNGKLFFKETHMNEILSLGRSRVEVDIETIMMIDILDMTDKYLRLIVKSCANAK